MRCQLVIIHISLPAVLTQEERNHLRCCDALVRGNVVRQPRKTWPYRCDHHLHNVTAIDRLNRKPEHGQYHPRYYSNWLAS